MWQRLTCLALTLGQLAGCGLLRGKTPPSEIVESLPEPAKVVVDLASAKAPSLRRDWRPELSVLPYAEKSETDVTIRNVRQCRWRDKNDYDVKHDDWHFSWDQVQTTDFIVVPFQDTPSLAHTMLSFGLSDGRQLALSVEARLEAGETYSPLAGTAKQYDLIYILGDETDLLGLRAEVRRDDIFIYRSKATPEHSAQILRGVLERANRLTEQPEFYDSLRNNCATNVASHIKFLAPDSLMSDWRLILPGHSDALAYDLNLIDTSVPFNDLRNRAYASVKIRQHLGAKDFSRLIRQ